MPTSPRGTAAARPLPVELPRAGHAVIIGFGLPGRAVADTLNGLGLPLVIIEANPDMVKRCQENGLPILHGDGRDPRALSEACVATARFIAIMVPSDEVMLGVLEAVRNANPSATVLARAHYTSNALRALHSGAQQVIAAEQVVAEVAGAQVKRLFSKEP